MEARGQLAHREFIGCCQRLDWTGNHGRQVEQALASEDYRTSRRQALSQLAEAVGHACHSGLG